MSEKNLIHGQARRGKLTPEVRTWYKMRERCYSENCKWSTKKQQNNNRRDTIFLTVDGVTKPITQWPEETGIKYRTMKYRWNAGWSHEDIITIPPGVTYGQKRKR